MPTTPMKSRAVSDIAVLTKNSKNVLSSTGGLVWADVGFSTRRFVGAAGLFAFTSDVTIPTLRAVSSTPSEECV